ncbi:MAG: rRNA maturation RNase YbeY [Spirochaetales bacterium]|nr:rRNA maturation RNase YbeY [Spirochaetales bacterium]
MNKIDLILQDISLEYSIENIEKFCMSVLDKLGINDWEFSIVFCDDDYIKELNSTYRKKNEATDILTFSDTDSDWDFGTPDDGKLYYAGDIALSVETLRKNAEYFKVVEGEELKRLLIHGILHLNGMDHETNNSDEEMIIYQENILKDFGEIVF